MDWNEEQQQRFDALRQRELAGPLSDTDQQELKTLRAVLEHAEAHYLSPALDQMQRAQHASAAHLAEIQAHNEALATLVQQHEHLLREAQSWLATFEQRRLVLQERYTRLTGEPLPTIPPR